MTAGGIDAIYGLGISHNKFGIPLPDQTPYPDHAPNISGERALEFLTHFERVREKAWSDCSFLDLGCSEGSTTFELSQMGSTVYGVEGREDAVRRAKVLESILQADTTHFEVGNVDEEKTYRSVDGIFNAGILYHLENPVRCLERCAANARLFIYLDTGHAPRDEGERQRSKFAAKFGRSYQIEYNGLQLDAVNFAEPGNTAEVRADGTRRGPRSGIGNSNSVWLSHDSAVSLMAQLGFPHHEIIKEYPKFPRLRTAFFRTTPKPVEPLGRYVAPLPELLPRREGVLRTRERDLAYLKGQREPVLLLGREPLLSQIRQDLADESILIRKEIVLAADGPTPRGTLNDLTRGESGLVVIATPDIIQTIRDLTILDRFQYAFASFAMAKAI